MCNSLWPHGPQHPRFPCPSSTPKAYSNSCPLSWWCRPTISSSIIPSPPPSRLQSSSAFFQMSQFFTSGDQSIGASASSSLLPMNIQDWFPLGFTCLIVSSPWMLLLGEHGSLSNMFIPVQFSSVTQSCLTLCDPMNRSTPGLPVDQLPEFTKTHVRRVGDAIQPSHPLSSPSPLNFNLSQQQGFFFKWVSSSHQVA